MAAISFSVNGVAGPLAKASSIHLWSRWVFNAASISKVLSTRASTSWFRLKNRRLPGEDEGDNVDEFKGLKVTGYQAFVSLECGSKGDKMVTIPTVAKLIREQWEMA